MKDKIAIIEIGSNNTKVHIYENNQLIKDETITIEFKKTINMKIKFQQKI